ncbi:MAG: hypothetical protein HC936_18045 [Leptolyngbyaceae cyanobacterium SU_3_3]|nr:hypothetical protein [Leptolyngbyaceae cyanobacterium SU_3_3]
MGRDSQIHKKSSSAPPPQTESMFPERPRRSAIQDASVQRQAELSPEWKARREAYLRNSPDLSKLPVSAPETVARQVDASSDPSQSEKLALKPVSLPSYARSRADVPSIAESLQRQAAPEEDLQAKF